MTVRVEILLWDDILEYLLFCSSRHTPFNKEYHKVITFVNILLYFIIITLLLEQQEKVDAICPLASTLSLSYLI